MPLPGVDSSDDEPYKLRPARLRTSTLLQVPKVSARVCEKDVPPLTVYDHIVNGEFKIEYIEGPNESVKLGAKPKMKAAKLKAAVKEGPKRDKLLWAWLQVLSIDPQQTVVGLQITKAGSDEEKFLIVKYTFAGKSNNTLSTRLYPITNYLAWRPKKDSKWTPDEDSLFDFMKDKCNNKQALSRAKSTMEAFRFLLYVCRGSKCLEFACMSPLLTGMAVHHTSLMGLRKQTPQVSLATIILLETLIFNHALDEVSMIVIGDCLFLCYLRARFYDGCFIRSWKVDKHFIIAVVEQTKTSRLDQGKRL